MKVIETEDLAVSLSQILQSQISPMGNPTDEQLRLINQFRPMGREAYTADELVSVPLMASNNLLTWGSSRWSVEALEAMANTYPGKPMILDHSDYTVKETVGFVYDAQMIESNAVPLDVMNGAGEGQNNQAVLQAEGYHQILVYAAIAANHPIVDALRFGRVSNVSTGCITDGTYTCPLDGTQFGTKSGMRCAEGHYLPNPWLTYYLDPEEREMIAPYYIKDGVISSYELSFVVAGNLPAASVPKAG
jgi:hypothetical protein